MPALELSFCTNPISYLSYFRKCFLREDWALLGMKSTVSQRYTTALTCHYESLSFISRLPDTPYWMNSQTASLEEESKNRQIFGLTITSLVVSSKRWEENAIAHNPTERASGLSAEGLVPKISLHSR